MEERLYLCIKHNDIEDFLSYFNQCDNKNRIEDKWIDGATPLILCVIFGNIEMIEFLIKNNANIEAQDMFGYTPILWASNKGIQYIIKLLLKYNADVSKKNLRALNAFDLYVKYNPNRNNILYLLKE
jgi:ankyrin repeat protein